VQVDLYDGCETGGWFGGLVAKRHHIHMVQRCSLSLLKFCGLCVCVCVFVSVCVCLTYACTVPKRVNRSRCHLGHGVGWAQRTVY